jgi:6,7-dimethyl-8-ribityllumazine synthase
MSVHNDIFLQQAGIPDLKDASVVIVHTEWNAFIVDELLKGCTEVLSAHQVKKISLYKAPGAFELSFTCRRIYESMRAESHPPDAIIALGCVIRGGTPHFEYVCQAVTTGITELNLHLSVPVIFGVLTVDTPEQAKERTGGIHGHKGEEAAITALKMMKLNKGLKHT